MGNYTSLNRPYSVLIMGIKDPYPPPTPLRVPMSALRERERGELFIGAAASCEPASMLLTNVGT